MKKIYIFLYINKCIFSIKTLVGFFVVVATQIFMQISFPLLLHPGLALQIYTVTDFTIARKLSNWKQNKKELSTNSLQLESRISNWLSPHFHWNMYKYISIYLQWTKFQLQNVVVFFFVCLFVSSSSRILLFLEMSSIIYLWKRT